MKSSSGLNPLSIQKYWKNQYPPDLNQLRAANQKFTDPYFPPNVNSLTSRDSSGRFIDSFRGKDQLRYLEEDDPGCVKRLQWKRVTDINPTWQLVVDKIEFNDVQQGSLGDCYFLSSITALTEYPYLIREKFRTKNFNNEGYYEVIFFIDGEWQIVFIDDYFPYDPRKRNFAFATPNGRELWAMLLEKAWAKLNGGYSNVIGGIVSDPISALTGFPTEYIYHKDLESDELFHKIEEGDKEGTIMSSASKQDEAIENRGLIQAHAYTLIAAKRWDERNLYLLKLRNPWGEKEWKGKWSDNSPCWTEEYKKYFGYQNANDGIFWIDINDYIKNFDATYVCHILYGSVVKNFYFDYDFKKPAIFNICLKEKSKTSFSILFKDWRFNRDIHNVTHPFSMILCRYDTDRKIKKLYGSWSMKDNLNIIQKLDAGYYCLWLYCPEVENDNNFKYALQISSIKGFDVEYLGLDHNCMLIQYLLLENYKVTGANNISASKDYFIGSDKDLSSGGISCLLMYNKTGNVLEIMATGKNVTNLKLLPPYSGKKNIKITLPPYESAAIVGVRLSNNCINFSYSFQLKFPNGTDDSNNQYNDYYGYGGNNYNKNNYNNYNNNQGERYKNLLKFNLNSNSNPDTMGLRTGEYKYVGMFKAKELPVFNNSHFNPKKYLETSRMAGSQENKSPVYFCNQYRKEFEILLKKYPQDNSPSIDKRWDKISSPEGLYIGQINTSTGELEGRGVYFWKNGIKYIGNWKNNTMSGSGVVFDQNNKLLFDGNYYNNKKYGQGKLMIKGNEEYYEGEFFDDQMEGKGIYHYANGDIWEGNFKGNMKDGVGIMTYKKTGDVYLVKFEKDIYMGSTQLNPEEKAKIQNLSQEQRKKFFEKQNSNNNNNYNNNNNNNIENLFLEKSMISPTVQVEQMNKEVQETKQEKRHRINLENIDIYKKKEPFMMEKFFEIRPTGAEEEMHYVEQEENKYLGGMITNNQTNKLVMQGRGVLYDGKKYYAGYWEDNRPNGFFFMFNNKKQILFQGFLSKDYSIDSRYNGTLYLPNGDRYEGSFKNNKMEGFGTYYYSRGDSWTGMFSSGKFNGPGKYFYVNGMLSQIINYDNNKVVSKEKLQREDFNDPNAQNFFSYISKNFPCVIEHILLLSPLRESSEILKWTSQNLDQGNVYIGQINSQNKFHGRCCFIYKDAPIRYYVGYIKNAEFYGDGAYYTENWDPIYKGSFEHNKKIGFGVENYRDGSTYAGQFNNDKPNGKGVIYFPNGIRFEGTFVNGEKNDKGFLINQEKSTKQEILYQNGNIIEQGDTIDYNKQKYKRLFQKEFDEFEKKCKKMGYEKYMDLMMCLRPTKDSMLLTKGIKEEVTGVYIGEMNSVGLKYGRGVLINNYTKSFFVGYFVNNEKHGKGVNYYSFDKPQYIGHYTRNKPNGKGEFFYTNGERLQGKFNNIGEGEGVYIFKDGDYWKGHFYAWTLNGSGEYFSKDGYSLGYKNFELNNIVN